MQQPVQPRMHFLLAAVHAGTCVHTDSAALTDRRCTLSQNFTAAFMPRYATPRNATPRHATPSRVARLLYNAHAAHLLLAPRRPERHRLYRRRKKSHESIVTGERESYWALSRARTPVVKATPTVFRVNQPRYVKNA